MSEATPGAAATPATPQANTNINVASANTAGTTPPATPSAPDWMSGFSDDAKGYIQNKGFKGPQDILESYRNFEKLQGVPQDRILKLPENMDAPEARAIWERLGAPKDAKDYKIDIPKEFGDPKMAEYFAQKFHELGVPASMAEKIVANWNEYQKNVVSGMAESSQAALKQADLNLKKEWGMAYDQNKNIVDQAARNLGMGTDEVKALGQSLGYEKAMKLLHKLGTATGEHTFVSGQGPNNGMLSPQQAQQRKIERMQDHSFVQRLNNGDSQALAEWTRLNQMAAPGEISL